MTAVGRDNHFAKKSNAKGILSPPQIAAQVEAHPDYVPGQVSLSATMQSNMARELGTARTRGAESSGDERVKKSKDSFIVLSGFNKSLREANLCKQADFKGVADLAAYLHDKGVDTSGSGDGSNEWLRLHEIRQEYDLTFKLDMIQKLSPIGARAYAYARLARSTDYRQTALQKKHVGLTMKTTKKPIKLAHPPKKDGMKGEASAGKFYHKLSNIQLDIKFTTTNNNLYFMQQTIEYTAFLQN